VECVSPASGQVPDKRTILVVDDEVLARLMLADELRDQGWTVIEAASADEALRVLEGGVSIDLVITDIRMPGSLDGLALARRVRSDFAGIHVVIISGERPTAAVKAASDGFFEKPYSVDRLLARVSALLR